MALTPVAGDDAAWVSVFRSLARRPCEERALVLGAMGLAYRVTEQPDGCHLLVAPEAEVAARQQLRLYEAENPRELRTSWPTIAVRRGVAFAIGFPVVILLAYQLQARYAFGTDWTRAGAAFAGAIRGGEWWRTVTPLLLHADVAHVAGNAVFGAFFAYLAGQYRGSGVAALATCLAAATGNLLNAWLQAPEHSSIGASTAVFAALGLVGASVWQLSRRHALGWARRLAPAVGAVALLAYTGTGDENTDIVAHLTGFACGAVAGALLGPIRSGAQAGLQAGCGLAAVALLALAWTLALAMPLL
jgi:membrane associated rhomboid family serine protease